MPDEQPLEGYHEIPLHSGVRLAWTTEAASLPISEVRLTESDVCMNKEEYGTSKGRDPYTLTPSTKCNYQVSGKHTDPRYEVIAKIREDFLFHENSIDQELSTMPMHDLKQGSSYSWSISQAPYFMWSPECEEKLGASTNDIMNDIKFSLNAVTGHENLYTYSTVYLLLTAILVFMYFWLYCLNRCSCWQFCFNATYFIEIILFIA